MRRMGKCPGSNEFSTFNFLEHPTVESVYIQTGSSLFHLFLFVAETYVVITCKLSKEGHISMHVMVCGQNKVVVN